MSTPRGGHDPTSAPFDRRAVSKALSRIANATTEEILSLPTTDSGTPARIIGITGAPGAGKSTLIGRLAVQRLMRARSLAVLAIDPTSPRSKGSLLGDRVRMDRLSEDPRVFIRSLPSGDAEDGLSDNLAEALTVFESFGFEEVIVETVGVGQTTYGIRALADCEILVLTPGAGDYIQAMKAGIMETADIYVINKADLPGADRVVAEVTGVLQRTAGHSLPPVIRVRAGEGEGVVELSEALDRSLARAPAPQFVQQNRRARHRHRVQKLILRRLRALMDAAPQTIWDQGLRETYEYLLAELSKRS